MLDKVTGRANYTNYLCRDELVAKVEWFTIANGKSMTYCHKFRVDVSAIQYSQELHSYITTYQITVSKLFPSQKRGTDISYIHTTSREVSTY